MRSRAGFSILFLACFLASPIVAQDAVSPPSDEIADSTDATPSFTDTLPIPPNSSDGTVSASDEVGPPAFSSGRRLRLSVSVIGGYDDNVNLTPLGSPSWYASPNAGATYEFGSPRLAFTLAANGGLTYYFDHPDGRDYDPHASVRLALAYKASPRLTFNLSAFESYQSQPDLANALSANRRLGNFFRSNDRLSAHYLWTPRFSTITSYEFSALNYESSAGSLLNRQEHSFGEQGRYLILPNTTATAQYKIRFTEFESGSSNSMQQTIALGLDQTFSPRLEATLRGGAQFRSANEGDRTSPYVETSVNYNLSSSGKGGAAGGDRKSSNGTLVDWTTRYSIEESDVPGGSSRQAFRTNLKLGYAITARIIADLNFSYRHSAGGGSSGNSLRSQSGEETFDVAPGVRYLINPHFSVNVGYRLTEVDRGSGRATVDGVSFGSYTRNRYFAGVTANF